MRSTTLALPLIVTLCGWSAACGGAESDGAEQDGEHGSDTQATHEVPCTDQSFTELTLFDEPNPAEVYNDAQSEGFQTEVDATGGGTSPSLSYVYLKFGEDGLRNLEISDEEAFQSLDWDIAIRRYIIRLNSGVSGPGEVKAARTKPKTSFESVDTVPDGLDFRVEEYFTDTCRFVNDSSGIGGPGTALASFWTYQACVAMTHNIYIIEVKRPETRHIKLEVLAYYLPDRQSVCDMTGMVPSPSGAGNMQLRWAFID